MSSKADKLLNWEGDTQYVSNDIKVSPTSIKERVMLLKVSVRAAVAKGFHPSAGVALVDAMTGPCSRCGDWTSNRRIIAFEPSDPQAFGSEPGQFRTFYFSLCSRCKSASNNAEQRSWVRTRATEMATAILGADGPKQ